MADILVVDDAEANRLLLLLLLKKAARHRVAEAADGEAAVARFVAGRYDLVLMDLEMPGMDGIDAARRMRSLEAEQGWPRTPLVAMTAHDSEAVLARCLAAGFDERIQKPLSRETLLALLQRRGLA